MKGHRLWSAAVLLSLVLFGCTAQKLAGTYVLAQPPSTDETVVEEVVFDGKNITLRSDLIEQTVRYEIQDGKLTIFTDYGNFSFQFEERENSVVIDEVEYIKQ